MAKLRNNAGLTMVELMMAALLSGVVFLAASTPYVSGLKLLNSGQSLQQIDPFVSLSAVTRNMSLANDIAILDAGDSLTLRLDYNVNAVTGVVGTAKKTVDTADDNYIKYRFIGGRLRTHVNGAVHVAVGDPEVVPGFLCTGSFAKVSPSGDGNSNAVRMTVTADGKTYTTEVIALASKSLT